MTDATSKQKQMEKFKQTAREVEADETDDALDKIMRKLDLTKKPDEKDGKKDE